MIPLIKAEFLKLTTIRSSYVVGFLAMALIGFNAFYIKGLGAYQYIQEGVTLAATQLGSHLAEFTSMSVTFSVIVCMLLITHEYQYKTAAYTVVSARTRLRAFAAKLITLYLFTLLFSVALVLFGVGMFHVGIAVSSFEIRIIYDHVWLWLLQCLWYVLVYSTFGMAFAYLFKNMTAAISVLYLVPLIGESIIVAAKDSLALYLPFRMADTLVDPNNSFIISDGSVDTIVLGATMLLTACYGVIFLTVAMYGFLKRDVN